ncbi:MAG: AAA family ATPase [Hungatella sp.]|jgi:cellulose biosynthesis protein BcsQ|nr:AAA family ATPase [Hungatella sp.]
MSDDTKIIFVGNYKGGVGKTTSVLNFAEHLAKKDKKVLVLDLDPQSSLSEILVKNNGAVLKDLEDERTLNYVFDLNISTIKKYKSMKLKFNRKIIQVYKKDDFQYDFIASSLFYRDHTGLDELAIKMEDTMEYLSILKNYLDSILDENRYDFVLIDCPPSNNLITRSAFLLSDYYVIPTVLDGISSNGVAHYINTINETYHMYCVHSNDFMLAKHYFGKKPKLIGVFCTFIRGQVNYNAATKELEDTLTKNCRAEEIHFFKEEINNYIDIARSTEIGEASKARNDYELLTDSILRRLEEIQDA